MHYIAAIGERELKVTLEEMGGARYKVSVDGRQHLAEACRVHGNLWSVLCRDRSFEVDIQASDEEFEVLIAGECHKFTLMNEQRKALARAAGKGATGKATVTSPMPGKVAKILVAPGEEVQSDQGVIVVEAMKMENELRSGVAGKVREICVKEGDVVEAGTKLVLIE